MGNLVDGQRQEDYGDPVENMELIAGLWSEYLTLGNTDIRISATEVAVMMALLKVVRLMNNPHHKDSLDDFNGYIEIARRCDGGTK